MKTFFKKKTTLICFIAYILITAFIFYGSLSSGKESSKQSGFVSETLSDIVEALTDSKVVLKEEGKIRELYPETIELSAPETPLKVGKAEVLSCSLAPKGNYELSKINFSSSNEEVLKVTKNGVLIPLSTGVSTITAKDEFSGVLKSVNLTVGSEEYVPEITFGALTGYSNEDNDAYYSPSNGVGAIYAIDYSHNNEKDKLSISVDGDKADVVLAFSKIYFYPKTVGDITFNLTATFDNINGKGQTATYSHTVSVKEKDLPSFNNDFSCDLKATTVKTLDVAKFTTNLSTFKSGLTSAQQRIFYACNGEILSASLDGDDLIITPKKVGETVFELYYPSSNGIKKAETTVSVLQGVPSSIKLSFASEYATVDKPLEFTVVGDGESFNAEDFEWTVSNGSFKNGKLTAEKYGKVTVTATHKTVDGFSASVDLRVRYSYQTYIRKIIGHFSLFFTLAIFAFVVYYRLAERVKPSAKLLFGLVFTLTAGILTAGLSEVLQSGLFVSGRNPAFVDALIDLGGYLLSTLICLLIYYIRKRIKTKKGA